MENITKSLHEQTREVNGMVKKLSSEEGRNKDEGEIKTQEKEILPIPKAPIIIFGFPHCGTSIVKSILGHAEGIYEFPYEVGGEGGDNMEGILNVLTGKSHLGCKIPKGTKDTHHILAKYASFHEDLIEGEEFKDVIKIFLIRNPYYLFSSVYKSRTYTYGEEGAIRYPHVFPAPGEWASIDNFQRTAEIFLHYRSNPEKDLYCLQYEELFDDNYKVLTNILDKYDISYTLDIFNNVNRNNVVDPTVEYKDIKERPQDSILLKSSPGAVTPYAFTVGPDDIVPYNNSTYRTWQINQPFKNMNTHSKVNLPVNVVRQLSMCPFTTQLGYTFSACRDEGGTMLIPKLNRTGLK